MTTKIRKSSGMWNMK